MSTLKPAPNPSLALWLSSFALLLSGLAIAWGGFSWLRLQQPASPPPAATPSEPRAVAAGEQPSPVTGLAENKPPATAASRNVAKQNAATLRLPQQPVPASKEGLEQEALATAEQLVAILPDQPLALHVMAMLHAQLHHTAEAEELWQRCIALDPSTEPYYVNLAAISIDRGENQAAVATLEAAQRQGLNSPNISHHLGVALNSLGRAEEAVAVAEKALESDPNSAAHWLILGQAQLQLRDYPAAEASLRRAVDFGARTKAAYFALFNACMRQGKREEAVPFREKYAAFGEDQQLAAEDRYQVLSDAEARRVCVSVLSEAAAIYLTLPLEKNAEHLLLRVLALAPDNQAACRELARIYTETGLVANEIVVRERLLELDPQNLMNYLELAKAYDNADNPQQAEAAIKLGISLSPQTIVGYSAMTEFLLEQQEPLKAQWYVEQALHVKPSAQGFELLASVLEAQGKSAEAKAARQSADDLRQPQP